MDDLVDRFAAWRQENPRLAHDGDLALNDAEVAAMDAALLASGLDPLTEDEVDEGSEGSPEQRRAQQVGRAVFRAVVESLGMDTALQARDGLGAVTVPELFAAYRHSSHARPGMKVPPAG